MINKRIDIRIWIVRVFELDFKFSTIASSRNWVINEVLSAQEVCKRCSIMSS
jgi:hypothetical protein